MNQYNDSIARALPHSVEVQRAKDGIYYWSAKVYFEAGEEADAARRLADIDADLRRRFLPQPQDLEATLEASIKAVK